MFYQSKRCGPVEARGGFCFALRFLRGYFRAMTGAAPLKNFSLRSQRVAPTHFRALT
jgi:hypothetical protein